MAKLTHSITLHKLTVKPTSRNLLDTVPAHPSSPHSKILLSRVAIVVQSHTSTLMCISPIALCRDAFLNKDSFL